MLCWVEKLKMDLLAHRWELLGRRARGIEKENLKAGSRRGGPVCCKHKLNRFERK